MELMVSVVPSEGVFEAICEDMWELRFDLLPSRLDANRGTYMDHSEYDLTVTFEDGFIFRGGAVPYTDYKLIAEDRENEMTLPVEIRPEGDGFVDFRYGNVVVIEQIQD